MIEEFLYNQFYDLVSISNNKVLDVNTDIIGNKFNKYCIDKSKLFDKYLIKLRNNLNSDKKLLKDMHILKNSQIRDYYLKLMFNKLDFNDIIDNMLYVLFKIATYNNITLTDDDNESYTPCGRLLNGLAFGKYLSNLYIRAEYGDYIKKGYDKTTYSKFKISYMDKSCNHNLEED